jgi:energy-coupling factor transporter transmembrane protein EcfT
MSQRTFFSHVSRDSPFSKMHPLPKITLLLAINLVALIVESPVAFVLLIGLIASAFILGKVPIQGASKFAIAIAVASQAVLISYLLGSAIPGKFVYIRYPWGTYVSEMTLLYAVTMVMRYASMLLGSTLVLATTSDRDIIYAFATLRVPFAIGLALTLAFRTTTIFMEDFVKVRDAMILRGAAFFEGSIVTRTKRYAHIFTSLVVIALRRVMETTYAIEAKGFSLAKKRTYLHRYDIRARDIGLAASFVLSVVAAYLLRYRVGVLAFPGWPLH